MARHVLLLSLLAACSSATDELKALAKDPAPCSADADCCVVTDGCMATSYVVGKADFAHAKDLAAEAENASACVACIAPLVDVRCDPGSRRCAGREIEQTQDLPSPEASALRADHCSAVATDPWPGDAASAVLGAGRSEGLRGDGARHRRPRC